MNTNFENNIELKVLLLGLYKKNTDETFLDIVKTMENGGVFNLKQGKKYLKELKQLNYILVDDLTLIGLSKAKEVELEFTI